MADLDVSCPHCGTVLECDDSLLGQQCDCPACGKPFVLQAAAETPAPAVPEPAPVADLPERMRANRLVSGRSCPACGKGIQFGEDVYNCAACSNTMHYACYEQQGSCASEACRPVPRAGPPPVPGLADTGSGMRLRKREATPPPVPAGTPPGMKECKHCSELIPQSASKCPLCQGRQDNRKERKPLVDDYADEDASLSVAEVLFGIFCGGLACIFAIIWIVQGKKKGWKLLALSLTVQAIIAIIRVIVESSR